MRDLHASQIKAAVEAVKARKEVNEVYFVACGGSQAVLMAEQDTLLPPRVENPRGWISRS